MLRLPVQRLEDRNGKRIEAVREECKFEAR